MPWKECSVMEERLRFVARLLEGEAMSDLAREFGISRKTGYKILNRYKEHGLEALCDRSRRPWRYANQLPLQIETLIVRIKREKPHWGARKVRELLVKRLAGDVRIPARSTVHAVLDRHGLVKRAKARRNKPMGTTLAAVVAPNALWCADFKGEFRLGNGQYCYPLTVTDQASRFILMCEALQSTREDTAFTAFQRIAIERIKPGKPTQNGRHERMHLTLKTETTRPPAMNSLQQQARFDEFVREFNHDRPHQALAMKAPADIYSPATRSYRGLPEIEYPLHDRNALVTACGRICMHRKKINISTVMAGQRLGLKEVDDGIWVVSFMAYDLGYIDLEQKTLQPIDNPFGTRVPPMS
jgi:transposase InsO family protein